MEQKLSGKEKTIIEDEGSDTAMEDEEPEVVMIKLKDI